jgi:hypothetical protein
VTAFPRSSFIPPHDADLDWYINHAESAQGMRSSLPALLAMIETGGQTRGARTQPVTFTKGDEHDVDIGMSAAERRLMSTPVMLAVGRARRLRARWQRLTPLEQSTLVEAFAARPFARETHAPLGQLAGVALLTPQVNGRGEWLLALCRRPGQHADALNEIRWSAQTMLRLAFAAWAQTALNEVAS